METIANGKPPRWVWPVLAALIAATSYLNWNTLWTVWISKSEVPWRDQWTYLDDARSILSGRGGLTKLWYPYWGHRLVITRLVTLLDVRFLSGLNTPIIALILLFQIAHAALLAYVAWRLFGRVSWTIFLLTATLIFQLSLSCLQMENLIWAGQIGYIFVYGAASAAFFLMALYAMGDGSVVKKRAILGSCLFAALISTLCTPDGIFVWPVLLIQAAILRLGSRVRLIISVTGCLIIGAYFWRYQAGPPLGMGAQRAILHPRQSLPLLGMLVVGPLSVVSVHVGTWLGCVSLVFASYTLIKAFRTIPLPPSMLTVYGAIAIFSLLTMSTFVVSRISPEFIAERAHFSPLPSRYFTPCFFFWASISGISLWLVCENRCTWPQLAVLGSVTLTLTFGTCLWQLGEAKNWRAYNRELDVAATALILDIRDPRNEALERIYPDGVLRSQIRDWLQQNKLSIFHERRGRLMGLRIVPASSVVEMGRCHGSLETPVPVNGDTFRMSGWAWDLEEKRPPRDLVFVNSAGLVVGLARSGLRRPDLRSRIPGVYLDDAGWQGYLKNRSAEHIEVYGVLATDGHYCRIGAF